MRLPDGSASSRESAFPSPTPGGLQQRQRGGERVHRRAELATDYDVRTPLFDPVIGAAMYAAKRSGVPLDKSAVARLRASIPASQLR
jgi:hypothetical protein